MTTIIVFGYYDDFAHFYDQLRKFHQSSSKVRYIFLTNNFSGYCKWPTSDKYLLKSLVFPCTQNASLKKLPVFKSLQQQIFALRLDINALSYSKKIFQIKRIINIEKPQLAIISGDSKPSAFIIKTLCLELGIKIRYFEQGPKGTTVFSKTGVLTKQTDQIKSTYNIGHDDSDLMSLTSRKFRYLDILQSLSFDPEKSQLRQKFLFAKLKNFFKNPQELTFDKAKKIVLLGLQDPEDVNFLLYSRIGSNEALIKLVLSTLPPNWNLIVREHPKCRGQYSKEIYKIINTCENALLDESCGPVSYWKSINAFICVNSLMVFEAADNNVPVFVLGDAIYMKIFNSIRYKEDLRDAFTELENDYSISKPKEINEMLEKHFYHGHFRKPSQSLLANLQDSMDL
jgi:hypothetical protein